MKKICILLAFIPVKLFAQPGKAVVTNGRFKSIQDSIVSKINSGSIPSFSVAVSKSGKVIWLQSFGWADKENKIKATPFTAYPIASLSKSITAIALMLLVEKGLMNMNDPVDKYLGNSKLTYFKGNASQLTISHLSNMAGGIPHQWTYFYPDENKQPLAIEEQIKRYGIVVFVPGEVFNYSNFSPGLAELIIKNVSGRNLSQFLKEALFDPLEMNDASVNRSYASNKTIVKGYNANGLLLAESEFYPKAGGGYYASVDDLLKFGMFHLKNKIINAKSILTDEHIDKLHQAESYTAHNNYYANGWGVLKIKPGMNVLLSNGAIDGTASSLLLLPESDIAIVCSTNATVGNDFTDQIAFNIANVLVEGYSGELQKFFEANAPAFADQPFYSADSLIGTWNGFIVTYRDSIPVQMIIDSSNKIFVLIQDQFQTLLNNIVVNSGLIQGQCYGNIALPETEGIPHYLEVVMKPGINEMYGSISAQSFHTNRPCFLLPSFIWLRKTSPD